MENKKTIAKAGMLLAGLLLVGAGCSTVLAPESSSDDVMMKKDNLMMENKSDDSMVEEGDNMVKDDSVMMEEKKDDTMVKDNTAMMEKEDSMVKLASGSYQDYSASKLALAEEGDVVLFFHANWCPTCRAADKNLNAESIPDGLTILKIDYDSATDLRKKYKLTTQHSFVQVDKNGNLINKWIGSNSVNDIKANLQ